MWRRFGSKLVVVELAVAMVLLVGAGLLGKSFYRLLQVDIGMQADHLATIAGCRRRDQLCEDPKDDGAGAADDGAMASLPGVKSVGISNELPVRRLAIGRRRIRVAGRPCHGERNEVTGAGCERELLQHAAGAGCCAGGTSHETEDASEPRVAIVNQALAKQVLSGRGSGRQADR